MDPIILSDLQQARNLFGGGDPGHLSITPDRLNEYYLYNGGDSEFSSQLGLALRTKMRKRVRQVLAQQRIRGIVNRPYVWRPPREERKFRRVHLKVLGFRDD
jgi:hypothetical protein